MRSRSAALPSPEFCAGGPWASGPSPGREREWQVGRAPADEDGREEEDSAESQYGSERPADRVHEVEDGYDERKQHPRGTICGAHVLGHVSRRPKGLVKESGT